MTALIGPPPPEFLKRSEEAGKYWSEDGERRPNPPGYLTDEASPRILTATVSLGTWKGPVPVPTDLSLDSLVTSLTGEDKEMYLDLLGGLLCWLPEERLTAEEACRHFWLRGGGGK